VSDTQLFARTPAALIGSRELFGARLEQLSFAIVQLAACSLQLALHQIAGSQNECGDSTIVQQDQLTTTSRRFSTRHLHTNSIFEFIILQVL
jgi:hypothetical protein